jgi:Rrf2 family protein
MDAPHRLKRVFVPGVVGHNQQRRMRLSARADYAVRALVELAAAGGQPIRREQLASAQRIPVNFLTHILLQLRTAGLVRTARGVDGGYLLTRPPDRITLADVIRAVEGPLANVRGESPEEVAYEGSAEPLREVWIAVRASLRNVLERVTLQDVATNALPAVVHELAAQPNAWHAAYPPYPSPA